MKHVKLLVNARYISFCSDLMCISCSATAKNYFPYVDSQGELKPYFILCTRT